MLSDSGSDYPFISKVYQWKSRTVSFRISIVCLASLSSSFPSFTNPAILLSASIIVFSLDDHKATYSATFFALSLLRNRKSFRLPSMYRFAILTIRLLNICLYPPSLRDYLDTSLPKYIRAHPRACSATRSSCAAHILLMEA